MQGASNAPDGPGTNAFQGPLTRSLVHSQGHVVSRGRDASVIHFPNTMRAAATLLLAVFAIACGSGGEARLTPAETQAIKTEIERSLRDAYDLSKPNVAERMLSLYPASGPVVSAASGRVVSSRDSLAEGIRYFWNNVGTNMRSPQWIWEHFYIDVLSPTSAVVTATYRIPHRDPHNQPHEIAGAMTEIFAKRGGKWVIVQEHLSDLPTATDTVSTSMPSMPTHEHH